MGGHLPLQPRVSIHLQESINSTQGSLRNQRVEQKNERLKYLGEGRKGGKHDMTRKYIQRLHLSLEGRDDSMRSYKRDERIKESKSDRKERQKEREVTDRKTQFKN